MNQYHCSRYFKHWGFLQLVDSQAAYDMELAKHATHAALEMDNTRRRIV
jgi:hypothetical protein